ncbi:hypothetical protein L1887_32045 [Cichorium endivia]|nr:hypothetical protein L1887_32045 [Cichorium endivia]
MFDAEAGAVNMPAINPVGQQHQVPLAPPLPQPLHQWNLPCGHLLEAEDRKDYLSVCVPLYNASIRGDWEAAQLILARHQSLDLVGYGITENYETALHVAASAKTSKKIETFVQNLVTNMTKEQLELSNKNSNTALCLAVAAGNINIVKMMLTKNPTLVDIPCSEQMMPLYWASLFGKRKMIQYLYKESRKMMGGTWTSKSRRWVLQKCVEANLFVFPAIYEKIRRAENTCDAALKLLRFIWTCVLTHSKDEVHKIVSGPVEMPPTSKKGNVEQLLETIIKNVEKLNDSLHRHSNATVDGTQLQGGMQPHGGTQVQGLKRNYSFRILFVAAEMGNTGFLVELIRQYPDLLWKRNRNKQTIFHVAISYRHQDIFNLLQEIGSMKDMITSLKDDNENNMLHLAGKIANEDTLQVVSGVALQMQRELLWFK